MRRLRRRAPFPHGCRPGKNAPFLVMLNALYAADLGYQVLEAVSAEEAPALVQNGISLDLVITDHLMPGMTRSNLARTLRGLRPGVPVLIISEYTESEGIEPPTA